MYNVVLLPLLFFGASPEIKGNLIVDQYKLVQLSVPGVPDDTAVLWDVFPEENADIKEFADGSLIFTGPPGEYKIKLRLIQGRNVTTIRSSVKITTNGPPIPNPPGPPSPNPPGPPNPPSPVIPDGKYRLAQKSKEWAMSLDSPNKVNEALALAGSFDGVIAAASAGTVSDVSSLMALARDSNRQALGTSASLWQSWFLSLKGELDSLYDNKTMLSIDDYKTAFAEISLGLRSVK
jgi:hypothetical protein